MTCQLYIVSVTFVCLHEPKTTSTLYFCYIVTIETNTIVNTFVEDASIAQKKANVLIIFYSSLSTLTCWLRSNGSIKKFSTSHYAT